MNYVHDKGEGVQKSEHFAEVIYGCPQDVGQLTHGIRHDSRTRQSLVPNKLSKRIPSSARAIPFLRVVTLHRVLVPSPPLPVPPSLYRVTRQVVL